MILRRIVESFDALSRLDERRQAGFDGGDRDRVGFAEMITPDRHHACDGSGRGHPLQLLVARLFGTAPARRPFADDPQRSTEALLLQLPPECGAVPAATFPKRVEKRQVRLERALTNTEDVASAPANDLSDGPAAEARASDDLLDRHALRRQSHNGGVGVLPPQIALVLQSFSRGEKVWIDRRRADRSPYLPHRFADRVEERAAGVLHQMPTIGDLGGVRQCLRNRFAIGAAAVSRDDLDLWAQRQPGLRRGALAIGQQRDDPTAL